MTAVQKGLCQCGWFLYIYPLDFSGALWIQHMFRAPIECETTHEYKSRYTHWWPPLPSGLWARRTSRSTWWKLPSRTGLLILCILLSSAAADVKLMSHVIFPSHIYWRIMSMKYKCIQEEFLPSEVSLYQVSGDFSVTVTLISFPQNSLR